MKSTYPVLRVLGLLVSMFALIMCVPLAVSLYMHDGLWRQYALASAITLACGAALYGLMRANRRELLPRHGVLLAPLAWVVLTFFATLPLLLAFAALGRPLGFTHAWFEATSGLSTTGSSVISGLDGLPLSINVWRTLLQWLGGMGILILAAAIMPLMGAGSNQLYRTEAAGPVKDNKLTPRIKDTAKGLWGVYAFFSLACVLAYWGAGMTPADAIMHMFTTVSLGGMSSHDASIGYFQSPLVEWIAIVFMLVASCNFALYFIAVRRRTLRGFWKNPEMRATVLVICGSAMVNSLILFAKGAYPSPGEALRNGVFTTVSMASTTAYSITDYLLWPVFVPVFLLVLSSVATSAGSTGCGIKMIRLLILLQQARREIVRLVHPRATVPVRVGEQVIPNRSIFSVLAFMLVYGATIIVLSMAMLLSDLDTVTAFSAVIASVNCVGSGLGEVGPASSYANLTDFQLWICTLGMLLGRLELFSFLAVLTPAFWRD